MTTVIIIPARLASSRFPGKMLCDVGGETLIRRVYEQCLKTGFDVYVATDSKVIADQVDNAIMIYDCDNGTERVAKAYSKLHHYNNVINVQGDMVVVPIDDVIALPKMLDTYSVATLKHPMSADQQHDPNTVKVISNNGKAHWFCRAPLSYGDWHYGIYAYRSRALKSYNSFKTYPEETIEKLEQLRWLQNGYEIGVMDAGHAAEINTLDDLKAFKRSYEAS